ncbi:MAG: isoleucine--tRNA ligase [Candidatus Shapirobacteria bacterium]|nr:isoleucine--tRNA ligase [Candidatus Shapirobacteria bacterium]MDD4410456.1 isoleucine--tRNA ligase [Candidatus Shapirobacteria bacterium]
MSRFKDIPQNQSFPALEEEIISFWKENKIFEKSVDQRPADNTYTFYDGPPFITGMPHHGHLLSSIAKDIIPRYQTMKGKKVKRVWGWDCHGLPAENKVEEKLGLKSKKDIEQIGVKKYIEECYSYVQNVSQEWPWYIDHIGRWVDIEHAYKTMDLNYMESVMWVFSELYKKGLIYKGRRISLYCPRCSTPLSNFEIAMDNSYKDVEDPAISIKFKLKDRDAFILAWTTTPWTLPGNLALAINKDEDYVEININNENIILAKARLESVLANQEYKIVKEFKGQDLIGLSYEPLYNFFEVTSTDYKIYHADFVSMTDGTGIVHIAPGFGEDDSAFGKANNLSVIDHVDDEGKIIDQVTPFAGLFVKKADPLVIDDLKSRNLIFKEEKIKHSYPFCYRCGTPLIYKSQTAWYLNVQSIKDGMKSTNQKINWVPDHIKNGRFGQGIETAPDWCLSRSRYWASPIPVWECDCGQRYVPSSIADLEARSGKKVTNLHKPDIDEVTIKCDKCGQEVHRVPEVLDCWFESGSMPYAERHYPFENKEQLEKEFPADYIIEYIGQTRGWFYTLHVLSNALFQSESFKNCVVTGTIMGNDGRKMSKLFKNYPDTKMVLQKYGGEAMRLYLMSSVIMVGENMNINEKEIEDKVKFVLLPLWNCLKYLSTYSQMHDWTPDIEIKNFELKIKNLNVLDQWIITRTDQFTQEFAQELDKYIIPNAVKLVTPYIEDLSRWYIRQSRDRFVNGDKEALQTLWQVLVQFTKTAAPLIPFITEYFWQNLVLPFDSNAKESVHLELYPETKSIDQQLLDNMLYVREICEQGNMIRKTNNLSTRQPLLKATVSNSKKIDLDSNLIEIIKNELNVKEVEINLSKNNLTVILDTNITPELKAEGDARDLIRQIQSLRKENQLSLKDKIKIFAPDWPINFEKEILSKTLGTIIEKSENIKIEKIS